MKQEAEYKKFIEELLKIFLPLGEKITVNDGEVILRTGDQNEDVYVYLKDVLKLSSKMKSSAPFLNKVKLLEKLVL